MNKKLMQVLVCPESGGKLVLQGSELWCKASGLAYPIENGIPMMLVTKARELSAEEKLS